MLNTSNAINRHLAIALVTALVFGGSAVAWSTCASLDGAIVAHGTVVVENSVKKVQHPTGGIVGILNVREDQHVNAGDVVVRLDDTATKANLGIIINELTALRARAVRLRAEREGLTELVFPDNLRAYETSDPAIEDTLDGERRAFGARLRTREVQKEQLGERIAQIEQEIDGLGAQAKSADDQLTIARRELSGLSELDKKGLVQRQRITALQKEISQNEGLAGNTQAKIAEAKGKISETKLQIIEVDRDIASDAAKDLRDIEIRVGELEEKKIAAEDQLTRTEIRAPISGQVHQLMVHTVGGVISAADSIMLIVPENDKLVIEARVSPTDIDHVQVDQETRVRFSAFNQRTTPELIGHVFRVSADISKDEKTEQEYFTAGISILPQELMKLGNLKLVAGMPAEAYIKTGERTFASYLMKPIMDQMARAMRED